MLQVRERITEGINRSRLTLELRRSLNPGVIVLLGIIGGLVIAGYIATHINATTLSSNQPLRFAVSDATGVDAGFNEVRYKGVVAGSVTKLTTTDKGPVLSVKFRSKFGEIYKDVEAELRPNTPLQDMYLNITDRGTPAAGKASEDEIIPAAQTRTGVNVADVLSVFQAPVRTRMATLLDQLGNGLADHGARLKGLLVELRPFLQVASTATSQLDKRGALVKRLVRNVGLLTDELAERQSELTRLVGSGSQTLKTLEAGSGDLASILEQLPPTLRTTNSSLAAVSGVVGDVDEALGKLRPVVDELPGALDDLKRVSGTARPAVRALREPADQLRPLVDRLRPTAKELDAAVQALGPQVPVVDKVSKDLVKCLLPFKRFFHWNASFTKFGDARALSPRGEVVVGLQSSGSLTSPFESRIPNCIGGTPIGGRPARDEDGQ